MGKAQSKRSVDITTETKKGVDDEVTEKMEKIEDVDKKDINGEATVQPHSEKKDDSEDVENDKDITTEKNTDLQVSGDSSQDVKTSAAELKNDEGIPEEISPLSDENGIKKSKKEKVKKKWSFRSISFGKKDKQKPGKTDETSENASATANGTDEEKPSPENEESQKEQSSADNSPDAKVIHENGSATEPEISEKQTEENAGEVKLIEEGTANTTNHTITENNDLVKNDTAAIGTLQETEDSSNAISKSDIIESDANLKETAADETPTIGNCVEEVNRTVQQPTAGDVSVEVAAENKNIPDVKTEAISVNGTVDEIHQNGTNNVCVLEDEQTKAQIEVNINTDKTSAETLDIISSSTSNNPSKAPVNFQNLNTSGETLDDVGVENVALKQDSRDINESGDKNDVAISGESNEVETDKLEVEVRTDEKFGDEPSPPPLPISPPPSQVSVFAFTNNEETADDSIQKPEPPISTQVEETTESNECLPISDNSSHEPNNTNANSDIENVKSSNELYLETICVQSEEIVDETNVGETNDDKKEENATTNVAQRQLCIDTEYLENGKPEVKEQEDNTESESLHNKEKSVVNELTEVLNNESQSEIGFFEAKEESSVTGNTNVCGDDHESEVGNELQPESLENGQVNLNADNVNIFNENINNSPESLSSIILAKTDADNDCLRPQNSHDKAQDDDNTISNKIDNLVREETKEFANPKDLKERATITEVKQDPSVTCE